MLHRNRIKLKKVVMTRIVYSVFAACLLLLATTFAEAQVGIGTSTPNSKAQLEVHSTTKGFLPPG
jgi:hypothetical protein